MFLRYEVVVGAVGAYYKYYQVKNLFKGTCYQDSGPAPSPVVRYSKPHAIRKYSATGQLKHIIQRDAEARERIYTDERE